MDGRELRIGMDFGDWPLKVAQRVTDRLPQRRLQHMKNLLIC
jgi:hypothetical protein